LTGDSSDASDVLEVPVFDPVEVGSVPRSTRADYENSVSPVIAVHLSVHLFEFGLNVLAGQQQALVWLLLDRVPQPKLRCLLLESVGENSAPDLRRKAEQATAYLEIHGKGSIHGGR